MLSRNARLRLLPVLVALVALAVTVAVGGAAAGPGGHNHHAADVKSKTDSAVDTKLTPDLQQQVQDDSTAAVHVVVALDSSAVTQAGALLTNEHVATKNGLSLMVGSINATKLGKLASLSGVSSVSSIAFKQTAQPVGTDPDLGNALPSLKQRQDLARKYKNGSVPYYAAPPLKTSNFDQLKNMNVLDAKTHDFTGAWKAGITGTGVTASVLDGGTDWGNPDLIGTWQTWQQSDLSNPNDFVDPGWIGWPKAFDPYSTIAYLELGPDAVTQNLTWYTATTPEHCTYVDDKGRPAKKIDKHTLCQVTFATRTGPARNFSAPSGTATHTYTFPASWTKSGVVKLTSHPDDYLLELYGERPAVLVTDPNVGAQYDTAYVDLNDDYSFADEKPVTKESPVSYRDLNGDGYTDLSGGLLYYISDGHTTIPGGPTDFGDTETPASGDFLAWSGDFDPQIEGHGTLTASNVVGQAVINGKSPSFQDLRSRQNPTGQIPGMVIGGAPNAKLAPMGDVYFAFNFSTQFAYLLTNEYGVQVTSNSYGTSTSDNDGMDVASLEADSLHNAFGNALTPVFSTGNGAPGYGTATAPAPAGGIQVGASTNFGSTGWDSITNYSQVTDNDITEWSNRGPGANGRNGVDVVADGSYAPGDATLNTVLDGRNAWVTWGGTSRSTPVTVGAVALIEQAYKLKNGSYPTEPAVKTILKSSANDLGYDTFTEGAGSIDASKAVAAAAGLYTTVTPNEWKPGTNTDPTGNNRARFPVTIAPGASATQTFTLGGPADGWSVSDHMMQKYDSSTFSYTSQPVSQESTPNFDAPDYLIDLTNQIKAHRDADLVEIQANYPHSEFDGDNNYAADQAWRLLAYDWTDVNHDGKLWVDKNGNGVVNHSDLSTSSNIDGFNDIDWRHSEIEQGEYERFGYHRPGANTLTLYVRMPAQRIADGFFLGLQHSKANPAIAQTHFTFRITYFKNVDWPWVTETQPSGGQFTASIQVPNDAPTGMYEGAVVAKKGPFSINVPVSVTVAPTIAQNADGSIASALDFGGDAVAAAQANLPYNNGTFFGANDWTWREESGDWRFFWFNVAKPVPDGTLFLSDTKWSDDKPTDLDTLLFGSTVEANNAPELFGGGAFSTLDTVGKSQNAYLGSGTWAFNTSTGGPEEVVAGPASKGPNAVVEHGVAFNGDKFDVPFSVKLGALAVNPTSVEQTAAADGSGDFDVTVSSSLDLAGLSADAFGLSKPTSFTVNPSQDDTSESNPSSASAKTPVIPISDHASRATFTLPDVRGSEDIDEFVVYDANNDGNFTNDEIVGSSTGPAGSNESVTLIKPAPGNYQVWVYGFQVSDADHTAGNTVGVDIVQGRDIVVTNPPSGPIAAGTPYVLHLHYTGATGSDPLEGELLLGPSVAPTAVTVPITIDPAPASSAATTTSTSSSTGTSSTASGTTGSSTATSTTATTTTAAPATTTSSAGK